MPIKKLFFIVCIIIFLGYLSISRFSLEDNKIKKEVLSYLENKYNEEFKIKHITQNKNTYLDNEEEKIIEDSYIYRVSVESKRLINFDVIYVIYKDENNYEKYKSFDILKEGIYENYIYEYKIREINTDLKKDIKDIMSNSKSINISLESIDLEGDNILLKKSSDSKELSDLIDKYYSFNKRTSIEDYIDLYKQISKNENIVIDMKINKTIRKNNLDSFKRELKELVKYLNNYGFEDYDINFEFNNYQYGRATRYLDNNSEEIYLIFDYEYYSDVSDEDKLNVFIY